MTYYLGLIRIERCRFLSTKDWAYGSFNLYIFINIDNWIKRLGKRIIIRFPLLYKVGELNYPGNIDEKLRCEVVTYIWI